MQSKVFFAALQQKILLRFLLLWYNTKYKDRSGCLQAGRHVTSSKEDIKNG